MCPIHTKFESALFGILNNTQVWRWTVLHTDWEDKWKGKGRSAKEGCYRPPCIMILTSDLCLEQSSRKTDLPMRIICRGGGFVHPVFLRGSSSPPWQWHETWHSDVRADVLCAAWILHFMLCYSIMWHRILCGEMFYNQIFDLDVIFKMVPFFWSLKKTIYCSFELLDIWYFHIHLLRI